MSIILKEKMIGFEYRFVRLDIGKGLEDKLVISLRFLVWEFKM